MAEKATQVKEDAVFSILLKLFFIFLMLLGFALLLSMLPSIMQKGIF